MIICDVCRQQLNDERYTGIFFKEDDMLKAEVRMDFCPNCYRTLTVIVQKAQTPKVDASNMELTITDEREDDPEPKQSTAERLIKAKPRKLSKVKAKPKPKKQPEAVEEAPEVPEEPEEELEDEKKPKYIDYGKIKALSAAGWPASEIAADVHCGVSTVYNYLAKLKKEVG